MTIVEGTPTATSPPTDGTATMIATIGVSGVVPESRAATIEAMHISGLNGSTMSENSRLSITEVSQ